MFPSVPLTQSCVGWYRGTQVVPHTVGFASQLRNTVLREYTTFIVSSPDLCPGKCSLLSQGYQLHTQHWELAWVRVVRASQAWLSQRNMQRCSGPMVDHLFSVAAQHKISCQSVVFTQSSLVSLICWSLAAEINYLQKQGIWLVTLKFLSDYPLSQR